MKNILPFRFVSIFLLLCGMFSYAQKIGDFRTIQNASGNWQDPIWEVLTYQGWVNPNSGSAQGTQFLALYGAYPGDTTASSPATTPPSTKFPLPGTVTIRSGSTVTFNTNNAVYQAGNLVVNGKLNMGVSNVSFSALNNLTISGSGALVDWNVSGTLTVPITTKINLSSGGQFGACSATISKILILGSEKYSACTGTSGAYGTFSDLFSQGGNMQSNPSVSSSVVAVGKTVNLIGAYKGYTITGSTISYSWTLVSGPSSVAGIPSSTQSPTVTLSTRGDYVFRLTVKSVSGSVTISDFTDITVFADTDSDGDGIVDGVDLDDDNDGILDVAEGLQDTPLNMTMTSSVVPQTLPERSVTVGGTTVKYSSVVSLQGNLDRATNPPTAGSPQGNANGDIMLGVTADANSYGGVARPAVITRDYMQIVINFDKPVKVKLKQRATIGANFDGPDYWQLEAMGGFNLDKNDKRTNTSNVTYSATTISNWLSDGNIASFNPTYSSTGTPNPLDLYAFEISSNRLVTQITLKMSTLLLSNNSSPINISISVPTDTDTDGTPNYLDLDSDNDGCIDAIEGGDKVLTSQLVNALAGLTVGTGSTGSNQNLCATNTCVDSQGVPKVVNSGGAADYDGLQGQSIGTSQDKNVKEISTISTQPSSETICLGKQPAIMTVGLQLNPAGSPVTYQWQTSPNGTDSWTNAPGTSTDATYQPPTPNAAGKIYYRVIVSTGCSTSTSGAALLQTDQTIAGTATATKATVCKGDLQGPLTLVGYRGAIQWQIATSSSGPWSDIDFAAARTDNYTPAPISTTHYYRAAVKDGVCDTLYSNILTVTVRYETDVAPVLVTNANFDSSSGLYTIPCSATTPKTANLSSITASNLPDSNTSIAWFTSTGTRLTDIMAVSPGSYYASFYDNTALGCLMTSTTAITIRTELCVNIPPVITVYTGSEVIRNMATQINPTGGSGNYTYSIATNCNGVTIPSEGGNNFTTPLIDNTTNPPSLGTGQSIVNYNAPQNVGSYSYCVTVCDVNGSTQCKTVPVRVVVIDSPIFACDQSLFLSRYDQTAGETYFTKLNYDQNGVTTQKFASYAAKINALGFNKNDNLLYAVDDSANLYKILNLPLVSGNPDPNAVQKEGKIAGLPPINDTDPKVIYNSGGFDKDGFLYLIPESTTASGTNLMYKVNISTRTAQAINLTEGGSPVFISVNDIAFDPTSSNLFYGYDLKSPNSKLVSISTTGQVTHIGNNTNLPLMGAMYTDALGKVYGFDRQNGYLYEFNKTDGTGKVFLVYQFNGAPLDFVDGANCFTTTLKFPLDISVTKTADNPLYTPGGNAKFTITVKNESNVYAIQNLTVQDLWPSFVSSSNSGDFTFTKDLSPATAPFAASTSVNDTTPITGGGIQETVSMPPLGTVTYHLTVKMPSSYTAGYTNNVSIEIPENYQDINGQNNIADATVYTRACYKMETQNPTNRLSSNHGITALGRAGADNGNWPMERKGAWTVLESKNKGFVINRIDNIPLDLPGTPGQVPSSVIANPVKGMMVYDITNKCLKINTDGTHSGWKCFTTQTCPPAP